MKIAVASEGMEVTRHFGHCRNYNIYQTENGEIVKMEEVENPGHKPGFLPRFLNDLGVKTIISGGMGGKAVEIFNSNDIEVIIGAEGGSDENVKRYLAGELETTGSVCHEHEHEGDCE